MKTYDLLEQGDVTVYGEWRKKEVVGCEHYYEAEARAVVMNEFAEALGVPHGSVVEGTFWVAWNGEPDDPDQASWEFYGFENFQVVKISPDLVRDLADAVENLLEENGYTVEDMADPGIAARIWEAAWASLKAGKYRLAWSELSLDKMLRNVDSGEVEELAYKRLSACRKAPNPESGRSKQTGLGVSPQ
ncbi:hypothetical protein [Thermosulfurimonas sp. F29]|uniref:hypothetical protein n=1 Tax=Thermosulfurimonas sp. F29 TaxID=2867247 RepID=UPI001C83AD27|nr:hypothetical protein [Thermosulfurimonas sp. F29]MBX6424183.1 hypothetical protein [Thermosulfurimonas sp. F29]